MAFAPYPREGAGRPAGASVEVYVKPTILVAGPSVSEGLEIQHRLHGLDCRIVMAGTASEVVRFTRNQGIDLLILSTSLDGGEGSMLIPILREIQTSLPIIVTTANHSAELEQEVRSCQIAFYAILPDDLRHLGEVVQKNLMDPSRVGQDKGAG